MSLFMLTERVDPSEIEACTERSKKAEKEASDAKSEIAKLKDLYTSMKRELTTAQADVKVLKAKK
jgi:phage terminase Nu1 subunit (DNA packaging protein)